ncbi:unnamed protein product [Camellia sinensis]
MHTTHPAQTHIDTRVRGEKTHTHGTLSLFRPRHTQLEIHTRERKEETHTHGTLSLFRPRHTQLEIHTRERKEETHIHLTHGSPAMDSNNSHTQHHQPKSSSGANVANQQLQKTMVQWAYLVGLLS